MTMPQKAPRKSEGQSKEVGGVKSSPKRQRQSTRHSLIGGPSPARRSVGSGSSAPSKLRQAETEFSTKLSGFEVCAPEKVGIPSTLLEDHRARMRWQASVGVTAGACECVLARDQVAYADYMGNADIENKTPVRETTLFRCFSMTKPITAVALMRLVQQGKVSMDDPVAKYIPSFRNLKVVKPQHANEWGVTSQSFDHLEPLERPPTLRHMLTHTGGLAYGPDRCSPDLPLKASDAAEGSYLPLVQAVDEGRIKNLAEFCDALAALPLRFQPGTHWKYSHGVDVVGRVIEVVSGKSLDAFLQEEVFQPLGMSRTSFFVGRDRSRDLAAMYLVEKESDQHEDSEEERERLAKLRRMDGGEESRWRRGNHRVLAGGGIMGSCSGGLVSCLQDTARFVSMLANGGRSGSMPFLTPAIMRSLWRDWLALPSVVAPRYVGRRHKLPGWHCGSLVGWNPLGHIRLKDKCLYMGGWSTNWTIWPQARVSAISMSQSLLYFDVPGWKTKRDELDAVVDKILLQKVKRTSLPSSAPAEKQLGAATPRKLKRRGSTSSEEGNNACTPKRRLSKAHKEATTPRTAKRQRASDVAACESQ